MSSTFIPGWVQKPFPNATLSAGGLLALAHLQTVEERTAITGGASWLDILMLAPGLHYQQAADELFRKGGEAIVGLVDEGHGSAERPVELSLGNAATIQYIQSVAKPGQVVTLEVGRLVASKGRYRLKRSDSGHHASAWLESNSAGLGWVSHLLYLLGPLLTIATMALAVLFKDWWCLIFILSLMLARLLNVWIIKQRTSQLAASDDKPPRSQSRSPRSLASSSIPSDPGASSRHRSRSRLSIKCEEMISYIINLGDDNKTKVKLRGRPSDLRQITSRAWLRSKTHVEGYVEAMAKLIVYLVAALSGNMTQVGNLIMMVLLLTSAGLLALSNHRAKAFRVNGVLTAPEKDTKIEKDKEESGNFDIEMSGGEVESENGRGRRNQERDNTAVRLAAQSGRSADAGEREIKNRADLAERGQAGPQQHIRWDELRRPPGQPAPRPFRGPKLDPRR
ncbi:hypothetical protein QBC38DRAFT_412273 [Podospora fimiseda]|uniref:Uncharacterized protein n=1 Tax=Podospora fimiseda TaxID=252190 RepID=A0AAN7BV70_9PEZI|nr:hypothetical protein QBC38DRAFT_412273 [Podospora fimiseda]